MSRKVLAAVGVVVALLASACAQQQHSAPASLIPAVSRASVPTRPHHLAPAGPPVHHPVIYMQGDAVACPAADECIAVGSYLVGNNPEAVFADRWNGSRWARMRPAEIDPAGTPEFDAVACPSSNFCVAVGQLWRGPASEPLIETWNGTSWALSASPAVSHGELDGISCVTRRECFAVGSSGSENDVGLIEAWYGARWETVDMPGSSGEQLQAISCVAAGTCLAVGQRFGMVKVKARQFPAVEPSAVRWDGEAWDDLRMSPGWQVTTVGSPSYRGAVSCGSAQLCEAAWNFHLATASFSLIGSFAGADWSMSSASDEPTAGSRESSLDLPVLDSLSCTSTTRCVATGFYNFCGGQWPCRDAATWNGKQWLVTPSYVPGVPLSEVACVTAALCIGLGFPNFGKLTAESWDGIRWTLTSPLPSFVTDVRTSSQHGRVELRDSEMGFDGSAGTYRLTDGVQMVHPIGPMFCGWTKGWTFSVCRAGTVVTLER